MKISEIAKMAGVSNSAVSRYFNNGYISEEKRQAIRQAVEKTGYSPSFQAKTLRTKRTHVIGVVLPRIDSSSMSRVVSGILNVLNENGYQMLLADTQNDTEKELEYLGIFNNKQVDGVIFIATVADAKHKQALKALKVPVVVIGQRISGFSCVYNNDYEAIRDITRLVIEKGHRNLGYIGVLEEDQAAGKERYKGYCDAVIDAGMQKNAANYVISDFSMEAGYEAAKALMSEHLLDAIVCATDKIAIGAMNYLKSADYQIPLDVAVTGHGDSTISMVCSPKLTTVHYDYMESGESAARLLISYVEKEKSAVMEVKMGFSIVENQSV